MIEVALVTRRRLTRSAGIVSLLLAMPLWAQLPHSKSVPLPVQPEAPKDSRGRSTPRGTVFGFLAAARKGNMAVASEFMNTSLRGSAAETLARQLFTVLDRRLPPRLQDLSDSPEGSLSDLRPDQDAVGSISTSHGSVEIVLERLVRDKSTAIWLFSRDTLNQIPAIYEEINLTPIDTVLPAFLVKTQFASIALFEWICVLVGLPAAYFLTLLLNRVLTPLVNYLFSHVRKRAGVTPLEIVPVPVRFLLMAFGIYWVLSKVSLPLLARQFWTTVASILIIAACVWLFVLLNERVEARFRLRLMRRGNMGAASVIRLSRRVLDALAIIAGLLFGLYHFGLNPTAALAGLGVGGIAVALAAQKTLENVLGGISLIFDRVVQTGDTLKVGDTLGTVEDIGLRSTRIRTRDRTLVSVPNGQVANLTLENLSARDKFWFHPRLSLRPDTTPAQMESVVQNLRKFLEEHSHVEQGSAYVRFLQFGKSSLDLDVSAYVSAGDWNCFLQMQGDLLVSVREIVEASGAQIAFQPNIYVADASPLPEDRLLSRSS